MASTQDDMHSGDKIPVLPLLTRIKYTAAAAALQTVLTGVSSWNQYFSKQPAETMPDMVKTYPCRPRLPIRIFFPKSYDRSSNDLLPVLFTIHGGGFVIGSPVDTDGWNAAFASAHSVLVIALHYAKAPANPYPGQTADVAALLLACLADSSTSTSTSPDDQPLPIDHSRVALAGWSAGGNLALAAAQRPDVRPLLRAVVPIYPVTDLSLPALAKAGGRRYKPGLAGFRGRDTDYLLPLAPLFDWAYCPAGGAARDPGLSVGYAAREALPDRVFVVACEMDLLAREGWRFVSRLAGRAGGEPDREGSVVGREEVGVRGELELEDERFFWEVKTEAGGVYRWLLVPDQVHGFDMNLAGIGADEETMEDARLKTEKVRQMIGEWLFANAF